MFERTHKEVAGDAEVGFRHAFFGPNVGTNSPRTAKTIFELGGLPVLQDIWTKRLPLAVPSPDSQQQLSAIRFIQDLVHFFF